MNRRVLGLELRRSIALWGGGLLLLAMVLVTYLVPPLMQRGTAAWDEEWIGLALQPRNLFQVMVPFVLGAGAMQGLREPRSGAGELLSTTARPAWQRTGHLLGAVGLGICGAFLILLVVGMVQIPGNTDYFHFGWLPIVVVDVVALLAMAWLGVGIGRAAPSVVTAPVLTIAALVGMVQLSTADDSLPLLSPGTNLGTDLSVFRMLTLATTVGQFVWFAGIAVTGFLLATAVRRPARLAALLPVVLAAGIAVPVLPDEEDSLIVDHQATELVCAEGSPKVCITRAHADELRTITGPAREALDLLAKLPDPPTGVVETAQLLPIGYPGPHGTSPVTGEIAPSEVVPVAYDSYSPGILLSSSLDPEEVRFTLLLGAGAPSCPRHGRQHSTRVARTVAAAGLQGELHQRGTDARSPGERAIWRDVNKRSERIWKTFRELPEQEQLRRIAALRQASLTCEGDLLDTLTSGTGHR